MLSFELKKKASGRIKKQVRRVLEIQEERMQVAERQVEFAMKNEKFAKTIEAWRNEPESIEEKNEVWLNVLNILPAHLLDFEGMLQDAVSYYGSKNADIVSGLVSEVVRETYDIMMCHLYDKEKFKLEDYNIQAGKDGDWAHTDGFHHFRCKLFFTEADIEFQWCKINEVIKVDSDSYYGLADAFWRYEFGHWVLCEYQGAMYLEHYSGGSYYSNMKVRKCAFKPEPLKIKQPNGHDAFRIVGQIMADTPAIRQTVLKNKAVEEDIFGYNDPECTEITAIAVFKRLKTLHKYVIELIPELCDMDLSMLNTIARMRMDYLFYIFMNKTYLEVASLQMVEDLSNAILLETPEERRAKDAPSMYEHAVNTFFQNIEAYKLPKDPYPVKMDFMEFLMNAGLIETNDLGRIAVSPQEISPKLMKMLLEFGYGAYIRVLMGRYKYQPIYTEDAMDNFINNLWKDLEKELD